MDDNINQYLLALSESNYADNTLKFYKRYLPHFNNLAIKYYNKPIYMLDVKQLIDFKKKYMSGYSLSSQNSFLGMLKGLQLFLIGFGEINYISVVPMLYNKLDISYSLSFKKSDFPKLKKLATNRLTWASFCALVCTGLRISELKSLSLSDIDVTNNCIYVLKSKTRSYRKVELLQIDLLSDFINYINIIEPLSEQVFPFEFAQPAVRYLIDNFNKLYNTTYTTHNTRSTYATLLYRKNVPLVDIMRYLGHKNLKTTIKYIDSYERIDL